jgi:type III pantothenate kinase
MILEMDFGNSRIKWRLRKESDVVLRGVIEYEKGLTELKSQITVSEVTAIWVASVLSPIDNQEMRAWFEKNFNLVPLFAESCQESAGVVNGYGAPQKLGVDRWLMVVAAYNLYQSACVVVSAGTATTVDLVNGKGRHLGGYIIPGWNTALKSLSRDTRLIKLDEVKNIELLPGVDTQSAVDHGLAASCKGLIENALVYLDEEVVLIATGGDAMRLQKILPGMVLHDELVLDGLRFVFKNR